MPKIDLSGFKDPVRRPRYIVWTFTVLFALAAFVVVALGTTSTSWFCADVCHKVQDDTIRAYQASAHSEISCMACHEPAGADPLTFVLRKVNALGELVTTVSGKYRLPLNRGSALSLDQAEMGSRQCLQCHSANRVVTPSAGLIIDHKAHADAGIWCTVCHNRTAHNEVASPPRLVDPTGAKNAGHPDFMKMDACFRCHDLGGKVKMTGVGAKAAPGTCTTCHPADFPRVPASHTATGWALKGHGSAALAADKEFTAASAEATALVEEGVPADLAAPVNTCQTCHQQDFCTKCHGLEMPHPAAFAKDHKAVARTDMSVCERCHQKGTSPAASGASSEPQFCDDCHHKGKTPDTTWLKDHPRVVAATGSVACFKCHSPVACATCHVKNQKP